MVFIQGFAGVGVTVGDVPDIPTGFDGTTEVSGVLLTWEANDEEDNVLSYRLYRADGFDQVFASAALVATVTGTSTTDVTTAASTDYTYFLVAHNVYGDSEESDGLNISSGDVELPGVVGGGDSIGVLPLVTGEVPPVLMYSDDGNLMYIGIS